VFCIHACWSRCMVVSCRNSSLVRARS